MWSLWPSHCLCPPTLSTTPHPCACLPSDDLFIGGCWCFLRHAQACVPHPYSIAPYQPLPATSISLSLPSLRIQRLSHAPSPHDWCNSLQIPLGFLFLIHFRHCQFISFISKPSCEFPGGFFFDVCLPVSMLPLATYCLIPSLISCFLESRLNWILLQGQAGAAFSYLCSLQYVFPQVWSSPTSRKLPSSNLHILSMGPTLWKR